MKLRKLIFGAAVATAGVAAYQNRDLLNAALKLERVHGDLFTRVENAGNKALYLSKNDNQSDELFKDWVLYNGWRPADSVGEGYFFIGEGYFFINDNNETLTIDREAVVGGRYILWTASASIE